MTQLKDGAMIMKLLLSTTNLCKWCYIKQNKTNIYS